MRFQRDAFMEKQENLKIVTDYFPTQDTAPSKTNFWK